MKNQKGFTLIEVITALVIVMVAFFPLIKMYTVAIEQVEYTKNLTTAQYLAKSQLEKAKNLGYSKRRILEAGNSIEPPIGKPPLELNGRKWRVQKLVRSTAGGPVEVRIRVFPIYGENSMTKEPIVEYATLIEDIEVAR